MHVPVRHKHLWYVTDCLGHCLSTDTTSKEDNAVAVAVLHCCAEVSVSIDGSSIHSSNLLMHLPYNQKLTPWNMSLAFSFLRVNARFSLTAAGPRIPPKISGSTRKKNTKSNSWHKLQGIGTSRGPCYSENTALGYNFVSCSD